MSVAREGPLQNYAVQVRTVPAAAGAAPAACCYDLAPTAAGDCVLSLGQFCAQDVALEASAGRRGRPRA